MMYNSSPLELCPNDIMSVFLGVQYLHGVHRIVSTRSTDICHSSDGHVSYYICIPVTGMMVGTNCNIPCSRALSAGC